jgi:hypothetical protein
MKDRAVRRVQNKRVIKKRLKLVKKVSDKSHYEHVSENPGRLRKQHPMDCGNSKCLLCHSEKVFDKKTPREQKQDMATADEFGVDGVSLDYDDAEEFHNHLEDLRHQNDNGNADYGDYFIE